MNQDDIDKRLSIGLARYRSELALNRRKALPDDLRSVISSLLFEELLERESRTIEPHEDPIPMTLRILR